MTYITTTSSFRPAVDDHTFDYPDHSYSQRPTNARQIFSPLVPDYYLDPSLCDPLHNARVAPIPSILIAESEHCALYDSRNMPVPSLPTYLDPQLEQSTAPTPSFANGEPFYDIPYPNQLHLHQADETTPKALPAPGLPYPSTPLTIQCPRSLFEPTNIPLNATSAFDQTQIRGAIHPPSASTTFYEFGGNAAALSVPPVPPATVNPATDLSNTDHICQCMMGGSLCNAVVTGSVQSVRNHLNQVHEFRGAGKDTVECLWAGCEKRLQRENIPRHIVTCHLRVKVRCVGCGLPLSRSDVQYSHAKVCRVRRQTAFRLDVDASSADSRQV